jgi:hypothetical protein
MRRQKESDAFSGFLTTPLSPMLDFASPILELHLAPRNPSPKNTGL